MKDTAVTNYQELDVSGRLVCCLEVRLYYTTLQNLTILKCAKIRRTFNLLPMKNVSLLFAL